MASHCTKAKLQCTGSPASGYCMHRKTTSITGLGEDLACPGALCRSLCACCQTSPSLPPTGQGWWLTRQHGAQHQAPPLYHVQPHTPGISMATSSLPHTGHECPHSCVCLEHSAQPQRPSALSYTEGFSSSKCSSGHHQHAPQGQPTSP